MTPTTNPPQIQLEQDIQRSIADLRITHDQEQAIALLISRVREHERHRAVFDCANKLNTMALYKPTEVRQEFQKVASAWRREIG